METKSLVSVKHEELLPAMESYTHSEMPPGSNFRALRRCLILCEMNPYLMLIQLPPRGTNGKPVWSNPAVEERTRSCARRS